MNSYRTILLIAAVAMLSCKNTAPLPLKANITSVVDAEGREQIRYEIDSDPETLIRFKTGAENAKQNEKEGFIEPNGRLVVIAPVWKGYDFKYQVGIDASKTEKGLFGPYDRSGHIDVVVTRKPRLLDGHCVVADHKCETDVAVDAIMVKGVEAGTIVAVGASQEKATSESVQVPIDVAPKVLPALMPDPDGTKASDIPKIPITITFPDGAKVQDEVLFPLRKLSDALKSAQSGRALRFGGEPVTGGARAMVFINSDLKMKVIGTAVTVAELDLVAKETAIVTEVDCGAYVGADGRRAQGQGFMYTYKVSVWERRTGKGVANREFKPKGSPCLDKVEVHTRDYDIETGTLKESPHVIANWLYSILSR